MGQHDHALLVREAVQPLPLGRVRTMKRALLAVPLIFAACGTAEDAAIESISVHEAGQTTAGLLLRWTQKRTPT